jgi:hypothetical protein
LLPPHSCDLLICVTICCCVSVHFLQSVVEAVQQLNADDSVDGILVQVMLRLWCVTCDV